MATDIIGSAINTKVLKRQNFSKEANGLETIIEAYAIKTSNRASIIPEKNTTHAAFSSASTKYSRMVVESVASEEEDGGITQLLVTFVGLTLSDGLPPAIVRLIPTPGAEIYGPPLVIEAEYITDVSETQFILGNTQATSTADLGNTDWAGVINQMPAFINGTRMPSQPRLAFKEELANVFISNYFGYCTFSHSCERRGLFLVARTVYAEKKTFFQFSGA